MKAFQDQIPNNLCYGCGPGNAHGHRIRSAWDASGEVSICAFHPEPWQTAGPTHLLYGGTIASLIDCHCVGTAIAHLYAREGRPIGSAPEIWCATAKLEVRYLRPTPIDRPVELRARIVESSARKVRLHCTLAPAGGETTVEGNVVAVRVRDEWRRP